MLERIKPKMKQNEFVKIIVTAFVAVLVGGAIGDFRATSLWRPVVDVRLAAIQASVDILIADWKKDHEMLIQHKEQIYDLKRRVDIVERKAGVVRQNAGGPMVADGKDEE